MAPEQYTQTQNSSMDGKRYTVQKFRDSKFFFSS